MDAGVCEFGHLLAVGEDYFVFRLHGVFLVLYVCVVLLLFWCGGVCGIRILNSELDFITDMHKHKQKSESVFKLKGALSAKNMHRLFAIAVIAALLLMTLRFRLTHKLMCQFFPNTKSTFTQIGWAT